MDGNDPSGCSKTHCASRVAHRPQMGVAPSSREVHTALSMVVLHLGQVTGSLVMAPAYSVSAGQSGIDSFRHPVYGMNFK